MRPSLWPTGVRIAPRAHFSATTRPNHPYLGVARPSRRGSGPPFGVPRAQNKPKTPSAQTEKRLTTPRFPAQGHINHPMLRPGPSAHSWAAQSCTKTADVNSRNPHRAPKARSFCTGVPDVPYREAHPRFSSQLLPSPKSEDRSRLLGRDKCHRVACDKCHWVTHFTGDTFHSSATPSLVDAGDGR